MNADAHQSFGPMGNSFSHPPEDLLSFDGKLFKERELKIKEFTQMNQRLNEMKEKFKKEQAKHSQPQAYLDQELSQISKTFTEKRKLFHQEDKKQERAKIGR